MKKIRIGLRLHIFLAFLFVFVLTFGIIIFSFNLILQNYINSDATTKIRGAIDTARHLAENRNVDEDVFIPLYDNETDLLTRQIIRPLTSSSDIYAALVTQSYNIEYPSIIDSVKERTMVHEIVQELKKIPMTSGKNSVTIMKTESNSTYYVSVVEMQVKFNQTEETPNPLYLILYFDATPFLHFAERINTFLILVLFAGLFLALITSLLVSDSIILSIRKLTTFAAKIGSGIYKREDFQFFDRELDTLASDMNSMAEKIDQADQDQKTFFQNASHELRTPLQSIQGYAEGIKYSVFPDVENAADIIISESQRLSQMVENLLSISRIDTASSGRAQIPKSILDLRELLESLTENMRGSAMIAKKEIRTVYPEEPIYILGNDNDLSRAFENILANGIRYANSTVTLLVSVSEDHHAIVTISDDGAGISESLLPTIFDRFSKGDGGKHGIGLALVKAIVKEHSGIVNAGNLDNNKGAVFTVRIPIVRDTNKVKTA